jgi:UDP-2-acetamido-3-amino-2,3-dideoxy-glucuronate N-acetyltransferase
LIIKIHKGLESNMTASNYFKHPHALVDDGATIGDRTKVWAFAHILPDANIGTDCNICDHVFIENNVVVGDRVTIKCGVQLWSGLRVGNDVFIGPNASFSNDNFPRSGQRLTKHPETVLEQGCSIGANATILPGLRIGRSAMVGAGAVVTRSVPPNAIVAGNPAQILGYASAEKRVVTAPAVLPTPHKAVATRVAGVTFHQFPLIQDLRGDLTVGEYPRDVPFEPKRHFLVFNVRSREIRGEHAHRRCAQFLICVAGSCHVVADDGTAREEYVLNGPTHGLFLPPMTWATQYKYSSDGVLLVLASEHYDPGDYIRDYDDFIKMARSDGQE